MVELRNKMYFIAIILNYLKCSDKIYLFYWVIKKYEYVYDCLFRKVFKIIFEYNKIVLKYISIRIAFFSDIFVFYPEKSYSF